MGICKGCIQCVVLVLITRHNICRLESLVGRHNSFKLYSLLGEYLTRLDKKEAAAEHYFRATMRLRLCCCCYLLSLLYTIYN